MTIDKLRWLFLVGIIFLGTSCSKEEVVPDDGGEVVENSRAYIYDVFKDWYFWLDEVPELNPTDYASNEALVDALLYQERDHWSFVVDLDDYRALFEDAETKGYGVSMALTQDDKLMVRFTYKNAPMGLAGVDRGWEIIKINQTPLQSIPDLNAAFDTDEAVDFTFVNLANDTVEYAMTRTDYKINTVLHRSVINSDGTKVGYLVFESFLKPSIEELNEAFAYFSEENIDELVVDLRYNGGGRLDVGSALEELIGGDEIVGKLLGRIIYNSKHSDDNVNYGVEGNDLSVNLDRLFFITTNGSASASELVINGMFPFKEVVTIGTTTAGKPVGMNVFESEEYNIALAPVTFKILNANSEGDYFNGIPVDYEVGDDIYRAWGDPEEACLKQALNVISGNTAAIAIKSAHLQSKGLPMKRGLQEITGAY